MAQESGVVEDKVLIAEGSETKEAAAEESKVEANETKVEAKEESKSEAKPEPKPVPASNADFRAEALLKRVNKMTAEKRELEARLAAAQAGGKAPNANDEAEFARRVEEAAELRASAKAEQLAASRKFDQDCLDALNVGKETYGEDKFEASVRDLAFLQGTKSPEEMQNYTNFVAAMLATGEGPKLIFELASDMKEASRIMELAPALMGIELAKRAGAKGSTEISAAPKPITPLGAKGRAHVAIAADDAERADNLDAATWMARRQAQVEERNKAAGRRYL